MQPLCSHQGQWYHSCQECSSCAYKLRSSRLLSQYICNILMCTDRCQRTILCCTHSCKNLTFTVTCLTVLWVKSLPFATANVAVLSIHTMVLCMYVGSTCVHCKSNRISLKYISFKTTLANALSQQLLCKVLSLSDGLNTMQLFLHSSKLHCLKLT